MNTEINVKKKKSYIFL